MDGVARPGVQETVARFSAIDARPDRVALDQPVVNQLALTGRGKLVEAHLLVIAAAR